MANSTRVKRGVSRDEWILEGLTVLNENGVDHVTVRNLARRLGIARSGFYWHFKDRDAFLEAMLDGWESLMTRAISENEEIGSLDPVERLRRIAELVLDFDLCAYEVALNHWAMQSKMAADRVRAVNAVRTRFVRSAFAELGFRRKELDARTVLFVCSTTWEGVSFANVSASRRRALISNCVKLLTRAD